MLKSVTKRIGEHDYTITQLDAMRGRRVFLRFSKIIAPAIAGATAAAAKKGGDPSGFAERLGEVVNELKEDDFEFFCDAFAASTVVTMPDGRAPKLADIFALHFAGDYVHMCEWLFHCLMLNFASFFELAGLKSST